MKFEAWMTRDWENEGMTWALIARERGPGAMFVGAFLIDAWCLGVKDAWADEMSRAELDELLAEQIPEDMREVADPADAKKLVEGAVAYAQSLGFLPARDFRKARKVLAGIDATASQREFTFGRDGRPCFVAGPGDDETRVDRVLAVLTARFGPEGFDFEPYDEDEESEDDFDRDELAGEIDPDVEAAIDEFYRFFESEAGTDRERSPFFADGFFAGVHVAVETIAPAAWMPALWGPEGDAVLPDRDAAQAVLSGMMHLYNEVGQQFMDGDFRPTLPEPDDDGHVPAAHEFCRGFVRAMQLRPLALEALLANPVAAGMWEPMRRLAAAEYLSHAETRGWIAARLDLRVVLGAALQAMHAIALLMRPPPDPSLS